MEGMNDVIFGLRLFRLHLTRLLVLAIAIFPRRNEQKLPACPPSKVALPRRRFHFEASVTNKAIMAPANSVQVFGK